MPSVQTVSILHRRHFLIFAFYFSITTVLSVSAGRSTRIDMSVDTQEAAGILFCAVQQDHNVASVWIDCGRYIQVCSVFAPADAFCTRSNIFGNMADVVVHDRFAVMEIIIYNQT